MYVRCACIPRAYANNSNDRCKYNNVVFTIRVALVRFQKFRVVVYGQLTRGNRPSRHWKLLIDLYGIKQRKNNQLELN